MISIVVFVITVRLFVVETRNLKFVSKSMIVLLPFVY
jgi:hypothetical protein